MRVLRAWYRGIAGVCVSKQIVSRLSIVSTCVLLSDGVGIVTISGLVRIENKPLATFCQLLTLGVMLGIGLHKVSFIR